MESQFTEKKSITTTTLIKVYKTVFYPQKGIHQRATKNASRRQRPLWLPQRQKGAWPHAGPAVHGKTKAWLPPAPNQWENRDKAEPAGTWPGSGTGQQMLLGSGMGHWALQLQQLGPHAALLGSGLLSPYSLSGSHISGSPGAVFQHQTTKPAAQEEEKQPATCGEGGWVCQAEPEPHSPPRNWVCFSCIFFCSMLYF